MSSFAPNIAAAAQLKSLMEDFQAISPADRQRMQDMITAFRSEDHTRYPAATQAMRTFEKEARTLSSQHGTFAHAFAPPSFTEVEEAKAVSYKGVADGINLLIRQYF